MGLVKAGASFQRSFVRFPDQNFAAEHRTHAPGVRHGHVSVLAEVNASPVKTGVRGAAHFGQQKAATHDRSNVGRIRGPMKQKATVDVFFAVEPFYVFLNK